MFLFGKSKCVQYVYLDKTCMRACWLVNQQFGQIAPYFNFYALVTACTMCPVQNPHTSTLHNKHKLLTGQQT